MKKKEIIFFAILFIIALVIILMTKVIETQQSKVVVITVDGHEYKSIEINDQTNTSFTIETEHGVNEVVITDGKVDVVYADCPTQVCVNTKRASEVSDMIVCLPHKMIIEIKQK